MIMTYLCYRNRVLQEAFQTKLNNSTTKHQATTDVISPQADNTQGSSEDYIRYDDVRNDDAAYTSLNRTRKEESDHIYAHLNEIQTDETEI